ncbi:MAG: N-terminal phage integrase SAM-like domain-containing protein [Defluviitaleaceae bacterium]|nr:N-terminal phage integrase SAM-like domain-containing protein [Defluviitaleaceae bacterium]MCL2273422.1 N-terminal phage integrase SAM-like domain-containing protein [Defluviitaleaceae bacterium]
MAKRGQGEGSISKRPDGTWWARLTIGKDADGKQKRRAFYGKTRKEVQEKLTAAVNDVNNDMFIDPSKMTVNQWLDVWMKEYKKPILRPTSYQVYEIVLRLHIRPHVGDVKLKDLRNDMVQKCLNEIANNGGSVYMVKYAYNAFSHSLDQAVKNSLVVKNVALGVVRPKVEKKASKVLTVDEQKNSSMLPKTMRGAKYFY